MSNLPWAKNTLESELGMVKIDPWGNVARKGLAEKIIYGVANFGRIMDENAPCHFVHKRVSNTDVFNEILRLAVASV